MIEDFYKEFSNDIALDADSQADFFPVAFFEKFSEHIFPLNSCTSGSPPRSPSAHSTLNAFFINISPFAFGMR